MELSLETDRSTESFPDYIILINACLFVFFYLCFLYFLFPFFLILFPSISLPSSTLFFPSQTRPFSLFLSLYPFVCISVCPFFFLYFFHVSLDIGWLQPYASQSLLPDEAAFLNHNLLSTGPPVQLHALWSYAVVKQNNLKDTI